MADDGNNPWYLGRDGQQHGPIQDVEMRKLVELGHLRPGDLLWRQGLADWQPAELMFSPAPPKSQAEPSPPPPPASEPRPAAVPVARDPAPEPVKAAPQPTAVAAEMQPVMEPRGDQRGEQRFDQRSAEPRVDQASAPAPAAPRAQVAGPAGLSDRIAAVSDVSRPTVAAAKPAPAAASMQAPLEPHTPNAPSPRVYQPEAGQRRMPDPAPAQPTMQAPGPQRPIDPQMAASIMARFGEGPQPVAGNQRPAAAPSDWSRANDAPEQPQSPTRGAGLGPVPGPGPGTGPAPMARGPLAPPVSPDHGNPRPDGRQRTEKRAKASRQSVGKARVRRRIALVLMTPVVLGALAAGAYVYRDKVTALAGSVFDSNGAKSGADTGKGPAVAELVRKQGGNGVVWDLVAVEFPEFAADRLREAQRMRADKKDEIAVTKFLTEAVIGLRRSYTSEAFASSPDRIKAIAVTFVETLDQLRKQGDEPCFSYISHGEASEQVLKVAGEPGLRAAIDKQLVAVVQAIAEGRKTPQTNLPPRKSDYDTLAAELVRRGWTDNDLQVFSDPRLLAKATPQKVCQLVSDWFTAHLGIADQSVQTRLLIESLRPVVSG